jgi:hypothetical protein
MITHIHDLSTSFLGRSFEKNSAIEYEEGGEIRIRIFHSLEQGMKIVDCCAQTPSSVHAFEKWREGIRRCGLPPSSAQEAITIRGPAAQFLHEARIYLAKKLMMFASDSMERILMCFYTPQNTDPVCGIFVVDQTKARHLYLAHGREEARRVLEELRDLRLPGSHESRLGQLEDSALPEESGWPTYHVEHDAASYLGMRLESFWITQRLPLKTNLISATV